MSDSSDANDILVNKGEGHLILLIALSMLVSGGTVILKMTTTGLASSWPSVVRIFIEALMWAWLWSGSNLARMIWLVLFFAGLILGVCATMYFGQAGLLDHSATLENAAAARLMAMFSLGFSVLWGYGVYVLQLPGLRMYLERKQPKSSAAEKILRRNSGPVTTNNLINLNDFTIQEKD